MLGYARLTKLKSLIVPNTVRQNCVLDLDQVEFDTTVSFGICTMVAAYSSTPAEKYSGQFQEILL